MDDNEQDFMKELTRKISSAIDMIGSILKKKYKVKKLKLYREIGIPILEIDGYIDIVPLSCVEEIQPNTIFFLDVVMEVEGKDFHIHIMFYFDDKKKINVQEIEIDELALEKKLKKKDIKDRMHGLKEKMGQYFAAIIKYFIEQWIKDQF